MGLGWPDSVPVLKPSLRPQSMLQSISLECEHKVCGKVPFRPNRLRSTWGQGMVTVAPTSACCQQDMLSQRPGQPGTRTPPARGVKGRSSSRSAQSSTRACDCLEVLCGNVTVISKMLLGILSTCQYRYITSFDTTGVINGRGDFTPRFGIGEGSILAYKQPLQWPT